MEDDDDLVTKIPEKEALAYSGFLKAGHFYWTMDGGSIAKISAENVRRSNFDGNYIDDAGFDADPCIGYWLDDSDVDAW